MSKYTLHYPHYTCGDLTLQSIETDNQDTLIDLFRKIPESDWIIKEIMQSGLPRFDKYSRRTKFGFMVYHNQELAGFTMLGIGSWDDLRGYTGADILEEKRGLRITPRSKEILFHIGFHEFGLARIETGCARSNTSSKKSIERTPGFQFEGTLRNYAKGPSGEIEDEFRYSILRKEWKTHYQLGNVTGVKA